MTTLLLFTIFSQFATSDKFAYSSSENQVSLIELYSSEGCSSCPPADKWIAKLKSSDQLWKAFVPIKFQVDYWNRLGWVDKFSNKQFSQRQRQYAREWGATTIYTPGFVLDGREWRSRVIPSKRKKVGVLVATEQANNSFEVRFSPVNTEEIKNMSLFVAVLGNGLKTKILAGENAGETLKHEFVVLSLTQKQMTKTHDGFVTKIVLPKKNPAQPGSMSLAFWVTKNHSIVPIQATGGDYQPLALKGQ